MCKEPEGTGKFKGPTLTDAAQLTCIKDVVDGALLVVVLAGALNCVPLIRAQRVPKVVGDRLSVTHNKQQLAVWGTSSSNNGGRRV
jgi:hypothetical protein